MKDERTGCIYRIWNTVNGMSYIGQTTIKIERRMKYHFAGHSCPYLRNAIDKYGKEAFQHEIIEEDISSQYINDREIYWISHFNTVAPNGYNLTYGGGGGGVPSQETRRKISKAHTGRKHSPDHVAKVASANRGKKRTAEQRRRLSETNKGRIHSEESRRNMSEAAKRRSKKSTPLQLTLFL